MPTDQRRWYFLTPVTSKVVQRVRPRQHARAQFLKAVAKRVPDVLVDLNREPYQLLQKWLADHPDQEDDLRWREMQPDVEPSLASFCQSLRGWGARWNLDADWIYQAAVSAMEGWHSGRSTKRWRSFKQILGPGPAPTITFEIPGWRLHRAEPLRTFKKRATADITKQLEAYCAQTLSDFGPRTAPPRRGGHPHRFIWAVRAVVEDDTVADISKSHPKYRTDGADGGNAVSVRRTAS